MRLQTRARASRIFGGGESRNHRDFWGDAARNFFRCERDNFSITFRMKALRAFVVLARVC